MKSIALVLATVGALCSAPVWAAAEHGNEAEVQVLVKRAVDAYKADKEKAYKNFNDPKGPFVDRDMYVFAQGVDGVILAHGANPRIIGKNLSDLKDMDGKPFMKERLAAAKTKQSFWGDYKWPNPVTKAMEAKRAYCEMADKEVMICSGIYAP